MRTSAPEPDALLLRRKALEQLLLVLFNRGGRCIAFATTTPGPDDDYEVALDFARVSAAAGNKSAYLSFGREALGEKAVSSWRLSGAQGYNQPSNGTGLAEFAWQPEETANGEFSGVMAAPLQLRAALDRDFASYDCVVCSIPPLVGAALEAPNPLSIAKACDGLVLVVDALRDDLDTVSAGVESARLAGVNLLGTVLDERHAVPSPTPFKSKQAKSKKIEPAIA